MVFVTIKESDNIWSVVNLAKKIMQTLDPSVEVSELFEMSTLKIGRRKDTTNPTLLYL